MPLPAGTALGPYEILSPVGAGGMGEVYRARDRRLDRFVAIKVLPEHLAADPDLRDRFEREARAVSSLNHPHICTLHDIGEQDGVSFLVMELLEGETLGDRLARGRLPIDEALRYVTQIADALDKAHRRGIVHRDLKPGNIMITKSGAKLLDFGLAKLSRPLITGARQTAGGMTATPTLTAPLTQQGSIVGTLQYMAPEQLEGRDADARTDVFAFGALLYEMVSGRRAFEGRSQVSIIAAIVDHDPPPLSSLQPVTPPLLDHLVKTCLAKDPDERWQTMADVWIQLRLIAEAGPLMAAAPGGAAARRGWLWWAALGSLAALSLVLAAVVAFRRPSSPGQRVTFDLNTPSSTSPLQIAISPDGSRLVWLTQTTSAISLAMRLLDQLSVRTLTGTETPAGRGQSAYPFWSPDSRYIAFFAAGKLKRIAADGGPAQTICDAVGMGGAWNRDGTILFAPDGASPLFKVSASGGVPTPVTNLDTSAELGHRHPSFLPDGKHFLYLAASGKTESSAIFVGALDSKKRKRLVSSSVKAAFVPPDFLLFMRETTLMAQRLDLRSFELLGEASPVAEDVGVNIGNSLAGFTASDSGIVAWRAGTLVGERGELVWLDRSGKQIATAAATANYDNPALSKDLQRIAVSKRVEDNQGDIWILDAARGTSSRFTFAAGTDNDPIWAPDDSRIVFASDRNGRLNLFQKSTAGAGSEELLLTSDHINVPEDWSPDGRFILYRDVVPGTGTDLWILPLTGDGKPQPYLKSPYTEVQGRFSPNGRWVAYVCDESGRNEVYIQSFPASATKYPVSSNGGAQPRWRADGKELLFLAGTALGRANVAAVDIAEADGGLKIGVQRTLFDAAIRTSPRVRSSWEISRDAQRFLVNQPAQPDGGTTRPITVLVNWTQGIRK